MPTRQVYAATADPNCTSAQAFLLLQMEEEGLWGSQVLCFFCLYLPGIQKQELRCPCALGTALSPLTEQATPSRGCHGNPTASQLRPCGWRVAWLGPGPHQSQPGATLQQLTWSGPEHVGPGIRRLDPKLGYSSLHPISSSEAWGRYSPAQPNSGQLKGF